MSKDFWEEKYRNREAQWNIGTASNPLRTYIDQLTDKTARILVPGMGHGHELYYLHQQGFTNSIGLDFTDLAVREAYQADSDFPFDKISLGDFFEHEGEYDIILEQAFFCSLPRTLRQAYVNKMHTLLAPKGKLVGLLFNCEFELDQPPYGGSVDEYKSLFESKLKFTTLETAHNSIKPRAGRELFFITTRQDD